MATRVIDAPRTTTAGTAEARSRTTRLILEDGSVFSGQSFGFPGAVSGEVVFNTGMVGYPEALTDPSYRGQILVLTYPLVGNYGVPERRLVDGLDLAFESDEIQVAGLVVAEAAVQYSHWNAAKSLGQWLTEQGVPGLAEIDTRALTKRLRERGVMLGKIVADDEDVALRDPNRDNLVSLVSVKAPVTYGSGARRVALVDCGSKNSIIRSLTRRGLTVVRVPWNHDFTGDDFDGVVISNGPGDPRMCVETIAHVRRAMQAGWPIFGICLGHQILALAAGAETYKLKFGHRGQNQPAACVGTSRCFVTSQNHGYAVDDRTLPDGWTAWFRNANDDTNEGIRHASQPWMSVQFHPEATPGPLDTTFLFDEFVGMLRRP
jgi:carbamoyl-phosphate synthase small subunit